MSSFLEVNKNLDETQFVQEVDENLDETQFVDEVDEYESSINDDGTISVEVLNEEYTFENNLESEVEKETTETDNITFTITDGSMNYNREYYTTDVSMNNMNLTVHNPIPRIPNQRVFNKPSPHLFLRKLNFSN